MLILKNLVIRFPNRIKKKNRFFFYYIFFFPENALKDDGTTSSQRGQRKTSELLHAHLQGPSLTANRGTNRSLDASSATLLKTGHNTEPPTNKNASISSQNGR